MSRAGLLYKIRPFVNIKIMKTLEYALIYPHIIYAIEVWGSAGITILNRLLVLQKRIVRLLSYSDMRHSDYSFPPSNPIFFKEQMFKVQDLFKMRIAKFIHNCLNKTSPVNFHLWFKLTIQIHNHNTRSKYISIDNLITTNNLFILKTSQIFPYGLESNIELLNINYADSMKSLENLPTFDITLQAANFDSLKQYDIDDNIIDNLNSRYYSAQEFQLLTANNTFNNSILTWMVLKVNLIYYAILLTTQKLT